MTRIELVARAIFIADNRSGSDWEEHPAEWERDEYRNLARAAIKAMREPTPMMLDEGANFRAHARPERIWRAMIDAALSEVDQ